MKNTVNKELQDFKKEIRQVIADYMQTEGCSCCRDIEGHEIAETKLAKMLAVKKYGDGSGYDFGKYKTVNK